MLSFLKINATCSNYLLNSAMTFKHFFRVHIIFGATVHNNVKKCNNLNKIMQIPLQMTRTGIQITRWMKLWPTSHAWVCVCVCVQLCHEIIAVREAYHISLIIMDLAILSYLLSIFTHYQSVLKVLFQWRSKGKHSFLCTPLNWTQ